MHVLHLVAEEHHDHDEHHDHQAEDQRVLHERLTRVLVGSFQRAPKRPHANSLSPPSKEPTYEPASGSVQASHLATKKAVGVFGPERGGRIQSAPTGWRG